MTQFPQIENVTKRSGALEKYSAEKLIKWMMYGANKLKGRVQTQEIVSDVISSLYEGIPTRNIQNLLIDRALKEGTYAGQLMAGALYAPLLHKDVYGEEGIPTVYALHRKLQEKGLMKKLPYSKKEYDTIESFIDHTDDFKLAHFQIKQIYRKYGLTNRTTSKIFETPQFVMMRMAMEFTSAQKSNRLMHVKKMFSHLKRTINAPTPNYTNAGTFNKGLISCAVSIAGDSIDSLWTCDTINYNLTSIGSGIGTYIQSRSINDPVRFGAIEHNGKMPYFALQGKEIKANMQGARAGAGTTYYDCYDPEAATIATLQNPRTPENRRNRDIHFAVKYHPHFIIKAMLDEEVFTFNVQSAPDLVEAMHGKDKLKFYALYEKYEKDTNFKKNYVNARDMCILFEQQSYDVGTHYDFFTHNANSHTPFREKIHSSNLCVAPETEILTRDGNKVISTLAGQNVEIWNGFEWSFVDVVKTGTNQKLLTVIVQDLNTKQNKEVVCTPYHKWYINGVSSVEEKRTSELTRGMKTMSWVTPPKEDGSVEHQQGMIIAVLDKNRVDDTYCFTEPLRHMGIFNGFLTGQCLEIMEVNHPYEGIKQLFHEGYFYSIVFRDISGASITLAQNDDIKLIGAQEGDLDRTIKAGDIEEGMGIITKEGKEYFVTKVTRRDQQPETAFCSLAGIVEPNVRDDEDYREACYYAMMMIDYTIQNSSFKFPHMRFTATHRNNAGLGLLGAATTMAREGLRYDTTEGLNKIHRMAERHMYFALEASLRLGKELGNAPWMHKTLWPEGWLPIDTYSKEVDSICQQALIYDWEDLRARIIANKGIRFSVNVAHMPTESSSKASGVPNSWYPVRELTMVKSDATNFLEWAALDSDILKDKYQSAWTISREAMIKVYAVIQKFTDQGISADLYADRSQNLDLSATAMLEELKLMQRLGLKSRYYMNSKTDSDAGINSDVGCDSGACTL